MADPMTIGAASGAGVGGVLGYQQQRAQNAALRSASARAGESGRITASQIRDSRNIEQTQLERDTDDLEASLRVLAAFSGAAGSGSTDRLIRVNAFESGFESSVINQNARNALAANRTSVLAQQAALEAQRGNPFLAGLQSGFGTAFQGAQFAGLFL